MNTIATIIKNSTLSLAEISRRLIIAGHKADASYVGRIARGEVMPSVELGMDIADILGVDPRLIEWRPEEVSK